ncbi:MAG: DNA gyrase inhibitor YacG [Robiginitomaculum sp.]|nr:MAG: DNA gyrase inhibitor YacG [Robiginitomaculum sp.]
MSKDNCKICKKPIIEKYHPFCSSRCTDIDLGRWLKGGYVIPGNDGEAGIPANDIDPDDDSKLW